MLRLFDNVPRIAQAQTLMGNRLMYGNYYEGYDVDSNLDYYTGIDSIVSETFNLTTNILSANYTVSGSTIVADGSLSADFSDVQDKLLVNSIITIEFDIAHDKFNGTSATDPPNTSPIATVSGAALVPLALSMPIFEPKLELAACIIDTGIVPSVAWSL